MFLPANISDGKATATESWCNRHPTKVGYAGVANGDSYWGGKIRTPPGCACGNTGLSDSARRGAWAGGPKRRLARVGAWVPKRNRERGLGPGSQGRGCWARWRGNGCAG